MSDLEDALYSLKSAALHEAALAHGFSCTRNDIEFALRAYPHLDDAFAQLLSREGHMVRFGYGVGHAYRRIRSWYAEGAFKSD